MRKPFLTTILSLCLLSSFYMTFTHALEVTNQTGHINLEKAKKIALQQVKGKIIDAEIEKDEGMIVYEIIIKTKNAWYEVKIDKATGKVLEVDKEGGNDD